VVPQLGSSIVPSHPTLYRLNMWSSWVRRNGITQVMYITKLKDDPKRVTKIFSMILKMIFGVEASFFSQNVNIPFI
jgi:hypothetical protein